MLKRFALICTMIAGAAIGAMALPAPAQAQWHGGGGHGGGGHGGEWHGGGGWYGGGWGGGGWGGGGWRGGGVFFDFAPPVLIGPPVVYAPPVYAPPVYAPPPYAYAPAQAAQACYAGPYVCPLDGPANGGAPCSCATNTGRAYGQAH